MIVATLFTLCMHSGTPAHLEGAASTARVLPDNAGAIAECTLHYLPDQGELLAQTYTELFLALPTDVGLTVLCPSATAADEFVSLWGADAMAGGREVRVVNVNREITLWARDRSIARHFRGSDRRAPNLIPRGDADYEDEKRNELTVARTIARSRLQLDGVDSNLQVEGGNVVANGRHVFVGVNAVESNTDEKQPASSVEGDLNRELGGDLLVVRDINESVPTHHVDMYVTPISEGLVLVGDPSKAELTLRASSDGLRYEDFVRTSSSDASEHLDDLQQRYDSVARQLDEQGYRVVRTPLIPDPDDNWVITYNNVLIEHRDGRRIVYMPTYAILPLDRAAARIYRSLGFEVRPIDVSSFYVFGGALRCLVNVTRRRSMVAVTDVCEPTSNGRVTKLDLFGKAIPPLPRGRVHRAAAAAGE